MSFMRHIGRARSSSAPLWCQIAIQFLGIAIIAGAMAVSVVTDPDRPIPVQQAELR